MKRGSKIVISDVKGGITAIQCPVEAAFAIEHDNIVVFGMVAHRAGDVVPVAG